MNAAKPKMSWPAKGPALVDLEGKTPLERMRELAQKESRAVSQIGYQNDFSDAPNVANVRSEVVEDVYSAIASGQASMAVELPPLLGITQNAATRALTALHRAGRLSRIRSGGTAKPFVYWVPE